ncbi:MAG: hypothetical protein C0490_18495 [Marivirga sp.]|nr:hypothetical protein [Marivirga sp.]
MTILFLSYWSIDEGLTQATVIPNIKLLATFPGIDKIILCTIERDQFNQSPIIEKVEHIPLLSRNYKNVFINKVSDFVLFTNSITKIVKEQHVKLIICRSSLSGGIGYLVSRRTNVPFVVESFEPHASYMYESGVWRKYDPRFWIEILFQKIQCHRARYLMPVAHNYSDFLIRKGVLKEKILTVPCVVDLKKFYRKSNRDFRSRLGITQQTVIGIYVGKFGGLYYDDEAYHIFAKAKEVFNDFCIIILTPHPTKQVELKLLQAGFLAEEWRVIHVQHSDVPDYLSIADFAFATYKPSDSKKFLSPVKVGEYWACGLPVLLTEGVGDDSKIIESSNCGAVFSIEKQNIISAYKNIQNQLKNNRVREMNVELANIHRNPNVQADAYEKVFSSIR